MNNRASALSTSKTITNIVFFLLVFSISVQYSYSQSSDENDQRRRSFINVDGIISGETFYFIDELSLEIGMNQLAQEGYIDEDAYVLGTGDILSVNLTGGLNGTMRGIRVNPQGDVILPNIGSIRVKSLLLSNAREEISKQVEEKYKDTEVNLSLDQARYITIHLTGDIPFPGKREVPALTRVDQAIYTAFFEYDNGTGSINQGNAPYSFSNEFLNRKDFTFRNISISGQNGESRSADLIAYFKGGSIESNPVVRDGDVITIRRMREYTPTITISGAVKSATELEYHPDDSINDLIKISNGYTHDADKNEINIFRLEDNEIKKIVVNVNQEEFNSFSLRPNDRIVVSFDRNLRNNKTAWVYGEATNPGNYPIVDGQTTALDLLEMAYGTTDKALKHAIYLVRSRASSADISGDSYLDANLLKRTSDQLLQGHEYLDLEVGLNRNQIFLNTDDREQLANTRIYDGDQLHIPKDDQTVYLMGQIKSPGFYPYEQNNSVDDYISKAGNFALSAETERVFVIKSGTRSWYQPSETDIESGDIIFVDRTPYDELQASRSYDMQVRGQRNNNIQLIMTGLATVTSIITTYVAITR